MSAFDEMAMRVDRIASLPNAVYMFDKNWNGDRVHTIFCFDEMFQSPSMEEVIIKAEKKVEQVQRESQIKMLREIE